jgi:hypothetical protein
MWPGTTNDLAHLSDGAVRRVSDGAVLRVGAIAPAGGPAPNVPAPPAPRGTVPAQQPHPGPTRKVVLHDGEWKVVVTSSRTRAGVLGAAAASPMPLSPLQKWQFAMGQFGSAALVGLVGVQLVSFYLPPIDAATGQRLLPVTFVSQGTIWGVFNVVSMTAAVCRLWDAVTDPLVANISDRLASPFGRRVPCMRWGALPACVCCALLFFPPVHRESVWNVAWLAVVQVRRRRLESSTHLHTSRSDLLSSPAAAPHFPTLHSSERPGFLPAAPHSLFRASRSPTPPSHPHLGPRTWCLTHRASFILGDC